MLQDLEGNRLLSALSDEDVRLIAPHLESVTLDKLAKLERPQRQIEHVYFLDAGIASVVSIQSATTTVEVGIIGRDGMSGMAIVLGGERSPYSTYMQIAGRARRIMAAKLRELTAARASMRNTFVAFAHAFLIQASETAVANARGTVEARLARWLLMCHDRVLGDHVPITHELLSIMVGAGRPGITESIHELARKGFIQHGRGGITVIDRGGLANIAGTFYGVAEREYDRLLGFGLHVVSADAADGGHQAQSAA